MFMAPCAASLLNVETIRDGGSLAASFLDTDGAKWILLLPIDVATRGNKFERRGFEPPVLIDADPAKRPQDTPTLIYSALSGPYRPLTWEEADAIVEQISGQAATLTKWGADSLNQLCITVASRGRPGLDE
jgi:hypothetical protein